MLCKNCGANNPDGSKFCTSCGELLEQDESHMIQDKQSPADFGQVPIQNQQIPVNNYQQNYQQGYSSASPYTSAPPVTVKKKKSAGVIVAICLSVFAIIVVAVFAVIMIFSRSNPTKKVDADTQLTTEATTETTETTQQYNNDNTAVAATAPTVKDNNSALVVPDIEYNPVTYYINTTAGLILRKGPSKNYDRILTIPYRNAVEVLGGSQNNSGWVYVYYSADKSYGWVNDQYISANQPNSQTVTAQRAENAIQYYDSTFSLRVSPSVGLILRSGPGTKYSKIAVADQYDYVEVYGYAVNAPEWYYVYYNGNYGYMNADYLQ